MWLMFALGTFRANHMNCCFAVFVSFGLGVGRVGNAARTVVVLFARYSFRRILRS